MKISIQSRFNSRVLFEGDFGSLRLCVEAAVKVRADLAGAYLARADLADADLAGANLAGADLARAYLARADLAGAYLADAYLARANLAGADLAGANLAGADLAGAYLARANLAGADLADADLAGANLAGADLAGAYLARANLAGADLAGAYLARANLARATKEEIERLDVVREIVLANPDRLDMDSWHSREWNSEHTPEEERNCGSTHCIAGWLQALSADPEVRSMDPVLAGGKLAPCAVPFFYAPNAIALQWLKDRAYDTEGKGAPR